ncbi:MAG TPA: hypothetical protein VMS56_09285 [Thermoanaerobaculia bacterium]|nr:hypothetical protein [Thermoanaerobaculia bacterium]
MGPTREKVPPPAQEVRISPSELAALLLQSILLAASLGFAATIVLTRMTAIPRPIAFGLGLELGLLVSYPTIRIVARANGTQLGLGAWFLVTLLPAALAVTILGVL